MFATTSPLVFKENKRTTDNQTNPACDLLGKLLNEMCGAWEGKKLTSIFSAPCLTVSHPPLFLVHFILHLFMKRVSFYKTCFVSQKVHLITLLPIMILAKEVSYTSPLWALYL